MRRIGFWAALHLLLCMQAQAQFSFFGPDKKVSVFVSRPPSFELQVRRVAFGKPEGSCSERAGELIDRMVMPDFQQNQMDVIEREALDQILAEHRFNHSGFADSGQAAQLGKILGPSALVVVSIFNCSAEKAPLYDDTRQGRVFISKTRVALSGSVRVVDLTTGKVLGSRAFDAKAEKSNSSGTGTPEFPAEDVVRDMAMQDAKGQIHAMFFPAGDPVELFIYDDKDCNLKDVYELFNHGDKKGAVRLADNNLEGCKNGHKKDKTLARAFYDAALLHCIDGDYAKAAELFSGAMSNKGADNVAQASTTCENARAGAEQLAAYQARHDAIPALQPIQQNAQPEPAPARATAPVAAPPAAPGAPTLEQRLQKLDNLLKRGLITKKEYDERKAKILGEI